MATSSYAGEIRSFFINPGTTSPLDNLGEVVESGLGWGLILYGEEEEKVMAASTDPVMSKVWGVSITKQVLYYIYMKYFLYTFVYFLSWRLIFLNR